MCNLSLCSPSSFVKNYRKHNLQVKITRERNIEIIWNFVIRI